jgi:hypothetical protein
VTEASFPLPVATAAPASSPIPPATACSEPLARMLLEIRRVPGQRSRITAEIEGRVMNRCVAAALEALSAAAASVELAGTPARPVVEASIHGEGALARAATAAGRVLAAVRRVQRAAENEFQVVGALTVGTVAHTSDGVVVTTGSSDGALHRLRERAGPGQIVLSVAAFEACHDLSEVITATAIATSTAADGPPSEEAYVYVGPRPQRLEGGLRLRPSQSDGSAS